jgi:septal ring factor EnvC (AmiA/AmiB activator)
VRVLHGALLLLALGAAHAGTAPQERAAATRRELDELRERIERLQRRIEQDEQKKEQAVDALRVSERAISEASRALHELDARSRELERELGALRERAQAAEAALRERREQLAQLLYRRYVHGGAVPLGLVLGAGGELERAARYAHYFAYLSRAEASLIAEWRAALEQTRRTAAELERKAADLAAVAAEQRTERARLEAQREARARVLARLAGEIERRRREIGVLRRDEQRLARLLEGLARLAAPALPSPPGAGGFARLKGRLAPPVRGEPLNRFGEPRPGGGASWKGLFIAAPAGEPVRAVAAGRVVFADWLRGFGNLLIVDHGGAYMSLYANNETLYKRVGDAIAAGEPVAAVGSSGGASRSGLYFEIRHQGEPLDPLAWIRPEASR